MFIYLVSSNYVNNYIKNILFIYILFLNKILEMGMLLIHVLLVPSECNPT